MTGQGAEGATRGDKLPQHLREAIDALPDAFAIYDADDRLLLCNLRYRAIYRQAGVEIAPGALFEHLIRRAVKAGLVPDALDDPEGWIRRHLAERRDPPPPYESRRGDRWLQIIDRRLPDGGLLSIRRDITEQVQARQSAGTAQQQLSLSLSAISQGIAIFDADRRLTFCNPRYATLQNALPQQLIGLTPEQLLHRMVAKGLLADVGDDPDAYVRQHVVRRADPLTTIAYRLSDGRLVEAEGYRLPGDEMIIVATDVTEARRREAALRDSERRFRDFAEASADWLWETDAEGRYTYASQAVEAVSDHPPEWYYGKRRRDFYRSGIEGLAELEAKVSRRQPFQNHVLAGVSDEGRAFCVRLSGVPVYDDAGTFLGYRGSGTEISGQVEAEQRVRESERRFREFAEVSADWLWETDADDRMVYASQAIERVAGRAPAWYYGKRRREFYFGRDIEGLDELEATVARRQPFRDHVIVTQTDKGRRLSLRLSGVPYYGEDGSFRGYRGSGTDITEQVRADQRVRESRDQLQLVLDAIPALIVYVDTDLICRFASRTALSWFARDRGQVLGRPIGEVRGEAEVAQLAAYHLRALAGETVRHECRLRYPDGVTRDVEVNYHPDLDPSGKVRGFIVISTDVTERRRVAAEASRAEERLRQAQKMEAIGQLTGGIAHDFNNLLTAITGNLSLLQDRMKDDPLNASLLDTAMRGAQRGTDLVSRLLAASRRQRLQPAAVDLCPLLRRTLTLLQRTLPQNIAIEVDAEPDLPPARVDPAHLEDALLNLAINARDAMPGGGRLSLRARAGRVPPVVAGAPADVVPGTYCIIVVADTGKGMTEEVLQHAFEPFFTTKGAGTGLGLSQVRGFVEQSGGHIRIDSRVGAGTTVELWLAQATEAPAEPAVPAGEPPAALGDGETVLVVEDDLDVRAFVTRCLRALDYKVLQAGDGTAALRLAEAEPIDLLLSDLMLPGGIEGPALAAAMLAGRPGLPVLFMSGYAERFEAEGLHHPVLPKPFSKRELSLAVRGALARPAGSDAAD